MAALPSDTLVVFAYAQAGLGHMRVADAIYDGLPPGSRSVLLSSRDQRVTYLHRITSIHPLFRRLLEYFQNGLPEELFTRLLRRSLAHANKIPAEELFQILNQEKIIPKTILVVATHFGLAHQFAAIKDDFAKAHGVRVILIVVVTDDSPQRAWAVPGADIIFCPSTTTKVALEAYHRTLAPDSKTMYVASPYMITPSFAVTLTDAQFQIRAQSCNPTGTQSISIAIPVSGAAVQLDYFLTVIGDLSDRSDRYHFDVVSKESMFTAFFLHQLAGFPKATAHVSKWDRMIIEAYEQLYTQNVITAEITKPSEQSFKALLSPRQVGGSILLFSDPVGRQEHDNLAFFRRHDLIPHPDEQEQLWNLAKTHGPPDQQMIEKATHWRGMRLPAKPKDAAQFIEWTVSEGIWQAMMNFPGFPEDPGLHSDGVARFWAYVAEFLR